MVRYSICLRVEVPESERPKSRDPVSLIEKAAGSANSPAQVVSATRYKVRRRATGQFHASQRNASKPYGLFSKDLSSSLVPGHAAAPYNRSFALEQYYYHLWA